MNNTQAVGSKTNEQTVIPNSRIGEIQGRKINPIEPKEKPEAKSGVEKLVNCIVLIYTKAKNEVTELIMTELMTKENIKLQDLGISNTTPVDDYHKYGLVSFSLINAENREKIIFTARKHVFERYIHKDIDVKMQGLSLNEKKCFENIFNTTINFISKGETKEVSLNGELLSYRNPKGGDNSFGHFCSMNLITKFEEIKDLKDSKIIKTAAYNTLLFVKQNKPELISEKAINFWKVLQ